MNELNTTSDFSSDRKNGLYIKCLDSTGRALCAEIFYYFALGFAEKLKYADKNEVKAADASCPHSAKAATKEGA